LAALARELAAFGLGLEAGDIVITGAYAKQRIGRPGTIVGTFSGIGAVSIAFV
jgi:2-keto-4-pentenoate hydratase